MNGVWNPATWRSRPAAQMPVYADAAALGAVEAELAGGDPVVGIDGIEALAAGLAEISAGRALLLQGGDCAETFAEPDIPALTGLFDRLCGTMEAATGAPVVRLARIAGQFAKPRTIEGRVWRGEIINGRETLEPDPARMLRAHAHSLATARRLPDALFASHEALLLPYEQALVRRSIDGRWWNGSGHFLWVGDRTRQIDGAHVEFLSGIANPVGVKCGPSLGASELLALCDRLDPKREPGRLTLIVRHGAGEIGRRLPALVQAVRKAGRAPVWLCDPMHGNTERLNGAKRRLNEHIRAEVADFAAILRSENSWAGGLHLEMTAEAVEECGSTPGRSTTACDPRLNSSQALGVVAAFSSAFAQQAAA